MLKWLNSCNALLHLNCPTAIEVVMVDKEPISIESINTPTLKSQGPPQSVSHSPKNLDELKALINLINNKKLPSNKYLIKGRANLIKSRLFSNDGNASLRVSDEIKKLLKLDKNHILDNLKNNSKYKTNFKRNIWLYVISYSKEGN